jgi:hypothetical protein
LRLLMNYLKKLHKTILFSYTVLFLILFLMIAQILPVVMAKKINVYKMFLNKKHNLLLFIYPSLLSKNKIIHYSLLIRILCRVLFKYEDTKSLDLFFSTLSFSKQKKLVYQIGLQYMVSDFTYYYVKGKFPNDYKHIIYSFSLNEKNSLEAIKDFVPIHYKKFLQNNLVHCFNKKIINKFEKEINTQQLLVEQFIYKGKSVYLKEPTSQEIIDILSIPDIRFKKNYNKKGSRWFLNHLKMNPSMYIAHSQLIEKYFFAFFSYDVASLFEAYKPLLNNSPEIKHSFLKKAIEHLSTESMQKWFDLNQESTLNFINNYKIEVKDLEIRNFDKLYWICEKNPNLSLSDKKEMFQKYIDFVLNKHFGVERLFVWQLNNETFKWFILENEKLGLQEEIKKLMYAYFSYYTAINKPKKLNKLLTGYLDWMSVDLLNMTLPYPEKVDLKIKHIHWQTNSIKLINECEAISKTEEVTALYALVLTDRLEEHINYGNFFNNFPNLLKEEFLFNKSTFDTPSPIELVFKLKNKKLIYFLMDKININDVSQANLNQIVLALLEYEDLDLFLRISILKKITKKINWYDYPLKQDSKLYPYYLEKAIQFESDYLASKLSLSENDTVIKTEKKRSKI